MNATSKHKSSGHISKKQHNLLFLASMLPQYETYAIYSPGRRVGRLVAPEFFEVTGHCVQTYQAMRHLELYNITYVRSVSHEHRWHIVFLSGTILSIGVSRTEYPSRRDAFGVVLQQIQNHHSSFNSPEKV